MKNRGSCNHLWVLPEQEKYCSHVKRAIKSAVVLYCVDSLQGQKRSNQSHRNIFLNQISKCRSCLQSNPSEYYERIQQITSILCFRINFRSMLGMSSNVKITPTLSIFPLQLTILGLVCNNFLFSYCMFSAFLFTLAQFTSITIQFIHLNLCVLEFIKRILCLLQTQLI